MDGKGTKWHRNVEGNFNQLSRAHERYRHTDTDARRWVTAYREHEHEFTFGKNSKNLG